MEGKNSDSNLSPLLLQIKINSLEQFLFYTDPADMQVFAK